MGGGGAGGRASGVARMRTRPARCRPSMGGRPAWAPRAVIVGWAGSGRAGESAPERQPTSLSPTLSRPPPCDPARRHERVLCAGRRGLRHADAPNVGPKEGGRRRAAAGTPAARHRAPACWRAHQRVSGWAGLGGRRRDGRGRADANAAAPFLPLSSPRTFYQSTSVTLWFDGWTTASLPSYAGALAGLFALGVASEGLAAARAAAGRAAAPACACCTCVPQAGGDAAAPLLPRPCCAPRSRGARARAALASPPAPPSPTPCTPPSPTPSCSPS